MFGTPQSLFSLTLSCSERTFDAFESWWRRPSVQNFIWSFIVILFVTSGFVIELDKLGFLPFVDISLSPLYSIHLAFTAVLVVEVIELVLSLSRSFSISVGKQVEIFSLILLRQAFEVLTKVEGIQEELNDATFFNLSSLQNVLEKGAGLMLIEILCALGIFALVAWYQRIHIHRPIVEGEENARSFIQMKKTVSLVLLFIFLVFFGIESYTALITHEDFSLFQNVYLSLIYADILLVLISYRFNNSYALIFRNSAYAGCTLIIRLALSAPVGVGAFLGLAAALLLPLIALVYQLSLANEEREKQRLR